MSDVSPSLRLHQMLPTVRDIRRNPVKYVVVLLALPFGLIGILQPAYFIFDENLRYALFLWTVSITIYWLQGYESASSPWYRVAFLALFLASGIAGVYLILEFNALRTVRIGIYNQYDLTVAVVVVATTMIATYREFGMPLLAVGVAALAYGALGPWLPGMLNHAGLGSRVITASTLEFRGAFGFVMQAGSRWVFIFLIYAAIIRSFDGLDIFMQLGVASVKYISSGIAQTAIISSMLVGSISGQAIANAALTGSFTIPMMKKRGIRSEIAGAIEAVASTGGQILPPVMGIVAFIMADLLELTYTDIIIMGAIPGLMFYVMVALSVHLLTKKMGYEMQVSDTSSLRREMDMEVRSRKELLVNGLPILASAAFLLVVLVVYRLNPARVAHWSILVLVGAKILLEAAFAEQGILNAVVDAVIGFFRGAYEGMIEMVPISVVLAHLGIVILMMSLTGIANRMALELITVAEISVVLFFLALSIIIVLLGMGVPTVAAYLLTVTVAVPTLTEFGYPPAAAHFFVLYVAILSNITPPVAMACAITANIADANFMKTAIEAIKMGIAMVILPYIIILNPKLILIEYPDTLFVVAMTFGGLTLLIFSIQNWNVLEEKAFSLPIRAGVFVVGILAISTTLLI